MAARVVCFAQFNKQSYSVMHQCAFWFLMVELVFQNNCALRFRSFVMNSSVVLDILSWYCGVTRFAQIGYLSTSYN